MPMSGPAGQRQSCGMITIGFSSASGIFSCRRSRWNKSVIFLYVDPFDPLDELDADELGEKLLSGMYLGCWGFSSPAGLSRRSSSLRSPSLPSAPSSIGSSMSHVN
uniref:(northern house mosquito) hypothetical protein n=1 Tax=Culex pipiens TaxID=7175 RepID=A0A8D8A1Y6_CULPI